MFKPSLLPFIYFVDIKQVNFYKHDFHIYQVNINDNSYLKELL